MDNDDQALEVLSDEVLAVVAPAVDFSSSTINMPQNEVDPLELDLEVVDAGVPKVTLPLACVA